MGWLLTDSGDARARSRQSSHHRRFLRVGLLLLRYVHAVHTQSSLSHVPCAEAPAKLQTCSECNRPVLFLTVQGDGTELGPMQAASQKLPGNSVTIMTSRACIGRWTSV